MPQADIVHWRLMTSLDLPLVEQVADVVHPAYPEAVGVFVERLRLYPLGCHVLDGEQGIQGYVISHPWRFGQPPALDTLLGRLPIAADTFYIHDIALLPEVQGYGFGNGAIRFLSDQAKVEGLDGLSLVSVSGSRPFWEKLGFVVIEQPAIRKRLLTYGSASCFMARALM
jgi:GNAT superfamily N-acetyltransferase